MNSATPHPARFYSLRFKLIFAFCLIGFALSASLGLSAYKTLESKLFQQLRNNVGNITYMGAALVNKEALSFLLDRQKADMSIEEARAIEDMPQYHLISDQLNYIRNAENELIKYVYLVAPAEKPMMARYVVDADVLNDRDAANITDEDVSHFGTELDMADFPVMRQAFEQGESLVEEEYYYDESFQVNSVSGYAPIMGADGKSVVALLGLDMADSEVQAALSEVLEKSVITALLALIVSLLTAVFMGTVLTRGIVKLDKLVHSFAEKDFAVRSQLRTNDEVGRLGTSFNHMAETIEEYSTRLEALVQAYGRFVPHDLLRLLGKKSILEVNLGDQVEREMTVLFSDIRNFTSISESMSPQDNFNFINDYLKCVGPHIRTHKGIIDKYIGDAVMALFPERVDDALDAALHMLGALDQHNQKALQEGARDIHIGIGVHVGKVMLGTVGESERMDGTVISDTVNLASRLEGMTKKYGCRIIISDVLKSRIAQSEKFEMRLVDKVYVAGKSAPVTLYEVFNGDEESLRRHKAETFGDYNQAVKYYYDQSFLAAEGLFSRIAAAHTDDVPARLFSEKVREILASGVPQDWDGVSRHLSK
ncbi:MAG: HAMP domain-containing protein [Alphaproteobacteria bacterium]|nr:HAMP domain-containing protein [Alphaproteobacteria bacterium]